MVIGEDQQPVIAQNSVTLPPHGREPVTERVRFAMLDFLGVARGMASASAIFPEDVSLPDVKEIGELGVVYVVEEGGVRDNRVHRLVRQVRLG